MADPVIIKIDDDTWRIENDGVRFFLLKGKEKALLVDSGMNVKGVREMAEHLTDLPIVLLNTHGDIDHVGGNDEFPSFMMHPSEAANYYGMQKRIGIIDPVYDGDIIDLGDRKLEVMLTPGHTPGSIMLLDTEYDAYVDKYKTYFKDLCKNIMKAKKVKFNDSSKVIEIIDANTGLGPTPEKAYAYTMAVLFALHGIKNALHYKDLAARY